jgi:hypothetical protein
MLSKHKCRCADVFNIQIQMHKYFQILSSIESTDIFGTQVHGSPDIFKSQILEKHQSFSHFNFYYYVSCINNDKLSKNDAICNLRDINHVQNF